MLSLGLLFTFFGFYLHRARSSKVDIKKEIIYTDKLQKFGKGLSILSLVSFLLAAITLTQENGLASGLIYFTLIAMAVGSLIIMLAPLNLIKFSQILAFNLSLIALEYFV